MILKSVEPEHVVASDTQIVKSYEPDTLGIPSIIPYELVNAKPVGRFPAHRL
jgi:hypothetical protein